MDHHRNTRRQQGLCGLTPVDVPWDGVRDGCETLFLCSSACVVALRERLHVRMDSSGIKLVTSYNCKRGNHTGTRGAVLTLARRVCVANGCSRS